MALMVKIFTGILLSHNAHNHPTDLAMVAFLYSRIFTTGPAKIE